jgi:dephospho-CoA kinase
MIRVAVLGDIGSGKSYVAKNFGYPVFNADEEVSKLYKKNVNIFNKLKKSLSNYIKAFPVDKNELSKSILANKSNLKKIVNIIHPEIKKKLNVFIKKNKKKKIIVLDIPLLLENKIYKKKDILIFVKAAKKEINKRLKKRKNFNAKLHKKLSNLQLSIAYKKKKSQFVINNNFTNNSVKKSVKKILNEIL